MNVKMIGVSGDEDLIVYMARVSNPSNQNTKEGNEKLMPLKFACVNPINLHPFYLRAVFNVCPLGLSD